MNLNGVAILFTLFFQSSEVRTTVSIIRLYAYTQQPPFWIARDEEGYWLIPAKNQGWNERTPFIGRVSDLKEITDSHHIDLGLPPASSTPLPPSNNQEIRHGKEK